MQRAGRMDLQNTPVAGGGTAAPPAEKQPHVDDLGARPNVETTHDARPGVRVAQGLGWFSIALGVSQMVAPRALERLIGVTHGDGTAMRILGAREIVTGIGLLGARRSAWWTAARLAGDAIDLALLALEMTKEENDRTRLAVTAANVLGVAALDAWATKTLAGDLARQEQVAHVQHFGKAITIDAPAITLYDFWRDLRNMPLIMEHLREVQPLDPVRSRWIANGPKGTTVRWEAEIVEDDPGELIAWRTIQGPFESAGSVRFLPAPGGRGTEVVCDMHYHLRGGILGKIGAMLAGRDPDMELGLGLRRLKQLFEIGETMKSDASIHQGMHAAMPASEAELASLDRHTFHKGGV